jgi:ribonuclease HIII
MVTISLSIDPSELKKLKDYILKTNLKREQVTNKYELLRIKDNDISLIVYESGKVVHNGSEGSQRVIDAILKKEKKFEYIIGSDETGKGEWYGPLVVVATALKPNEILELRKLGVRDSKTISKKELITLANKIISMKFFRGSRPISPETYNQHYFKLEKEGKSLNDLLAWAHAETIKDLEEKIGNKKIRIVIDKFDVKKMESRLRGKARQRRLLGDNIEVIQKSKGESEIPVAAASIIAKKIFEERVDKLNKKFGINLREAKPEDIDPKILPLVAKTHFKNVSKCLE